MAPPSKKSKKLQDIQPVIPLPQLNLFTRNPIQLTVQNIKEDEIMPTGTWGQESGEITFNINGDPEHWIDPSSIRVGVKFKVVYGDGTLLEDHAEVAPVANLSGSLCEKVQIRIGNSTQICGWDNLYPYICYFQHVFHSQESFQNQMDFPWFLFKDTSGAFDNLDPNENLGYGKRKIQVADSFENYIYFPICSPITDQDKLLPPNINIQIVLQRAKNIFSLMTGGVTTARNPKILILDVSLRVQKIRLNSELHLNLQNALVRGPAIYPVIQRQMFEFSKVGGTRLVKETIFTDRLLPNYVYLFITGTDRRMGSYVLNPFEVNFESLNDIKLVSGGENYPAIPYTDIDFNTRNVQHPYLDVMNCLGFLDDDKGRKNGLDCATWMGGYGLFGFNLTRSQLPGNQGRFVNDAPRLAELQVHASFRQETILRLTFMFILEYNSNVYISSNLDVTTDFMS